MPLRYLSAVPEGPVLSANVEIAISQISALCLQFACTIIDACLPQTRKTLRNVFHCNIAEKRFVGKLVIIQAFS